MFDTLKMNASLWKDNIAMRTTLFSSKDGPYRKDTSMATEYKTEEEKQKAIEEIEKRQEEPYTVQRAEDIVKTINQGILFNRTPIEYMDHLADQDDKMLDLALYLSKTDADHQVRADYLTNKFIIKLNQACEYVGLPKYISIPDEKLQGEREIVFDAPDYSLVSEDIANALKQELVDIENRKAAREEYITKFYEDVNAYNAKLHEDIAKELEEEAKKKAEKEAKKAEKEAKKAEKKAEREARKEAKKAEKAEEKKADDIEDAVVVELDKPQHNREASTKAAKSTTTSKSGNKKGGTGKTEDSSDSGDPDPAPSKTNLDEIIPLEKVVPIHIIDDEEEKKRLLAENEAELQKLGFMKDAANGGIKVTSEATKQIADIADSINNGELPSDETIQAALDAAEKELQQRQQQQMQPIDVAHISGRFPAAEIGTRTDLQLIQDGLNVACSNIAGVTATVTPKEGIKDQYNVMIANNGVVVDTFTAHGSRIFGKGVPVLEGYVDVGGGTLVDYFVPIHNPAAVRENIFRRVDIRNIEGQLISTPKGTNLELAKAVELSIWKDHALLDYLDLSTHAFTNDNEAYAFFHYAALAINEIERLLGGRDKLSIYRVSNYKAYDKFDLVSDALAYGSRAPYACNTERGRVVLNLPRENNIAANVSGNKLHVVQPDGKATDFILPA